MLDDTHKTLIIELGSIMWLVKGTSTGHESVVNYIDYVVRVLSLLIHLAYFVFIIFIKDFQKRQLLYLHHVNFIGMIYTLHYCCYIFGQSPQFGSPEINDAICFLSSIVWMVTKFLRMYSLLLLAIYRYVAVYNIKYHRIFTGKLSHMILAILFVWIFSIVASFILKYSFNTTYAVFYCFEGDSQNLNIVAWFMVINTGFSIVLPSVLIL